MESQSIGDLFGVLVSNLLSRPIDIIVRQVGGGNRIGIPGKVEEKAHGHLYGLYVADVYDLKLVHAGLIGQRHLVRDTFDFGKHSTNGKRLGPQVVDMIILAVDSATLVTPQNDQCAIDSGKSAVDGLDSKGLLLPFHLVGSDFPLPRQQVDVRALAEGADDDASFTGGVSLVIKAGSLTRNF